MDFISVSKMKPVVVKMKTLKTVLAVLVVVALFPLVLFAMKLNANGIELFLTEGNRVGSNQTIADWRQVNATPARKILSSGETSLISKILDFFKGSHGISEKSLPLCPEKPPGLVGRIAVNKTSVTPEELDRKYDSVETGGLFKPKNCTSRDKVAIIVPYRDRLHHLLVLVNNLIPYLNKQQAEFRIYVIEQAPGYSFSRAMMMNIGFVEAMKTDNFTCFVFHDVDLLPENDKNLYRCGSNPRHMSVSNSKFRYGLPYTQYAGGVVSLSREQFEKINGMSNLFFGWGGEDDDLYSRIAAKGYKLVRYSMEIGRYTAQPHPRDKGNPSNPARFKLLGASSRKRQDKDGMNSLKYKTEKIELESLYTLIRVSPDMGFYRAELKRTIG